MNTLAETIATVMPQAYEEVSSQLSLPSDYDLSRSVYCSELTLSLQQKLGLLGIPARRELHSDAPNTNLWHFVIAHSLEPSEDEPITDCSPWQFTPEEAGHSGYYHGTRSDLMKLLAESGTPAPRISVIGLVTIFTPDTPHYNPYDHELYDERKAFKAAGGY